MLTLAQIMKYILSSAAETETAALFLTAKEMVSLRNTLEEMGWKQPESPLQCDNSTAVGYTNQTIISKKSKSWDLRLRWLRCRVAQDQFRIYWDKGRNNFGTAADGEASFIHFIFVAHNGGAFNTEDYEDTMRNVIRGQTCD